MALNITGVNETGRYKEALTQLYARLEYKVLKCNTVIEVELYYYTTKTVFQADGATAKTGNSYELPYDKATDGEVTLDLVHDKIKDHLVEIEKYTADQLTKVDLS